MRARLFAWCLVWLVGCSAPAPTPTSCLTNLDCPRDTVCIVGRCAAPTDSEAAPDAGATDAGVDASVLDADTLDADTLDADTLDADAMDAGFDAASSDVGALDVDGGTTDSGPEDAARAVDAASAVDAGGMDAGRDAATSDAGRDAATSDAGRDAAGDANADGGRDANTDASPDAGSALQAGVIVPLYVDPTDLRWTQLATAARAHPRVAFIAIINPNDGPTATADPAYATGIVALQSAGVRVIGYVATGFGARAEAAVNGDVDLYDAQYPTLDGIFFDEAGTYEFGHEIRYAREAMHARALGLNLLVANPGADPEVIYLSIFDISVNYEGVGAPLASTLTGYITRRNASAILVYGVPTLDTAYVGSVRPYVEYIYLTDDVDPNPWDSLPSYFNALLTALD